MGDHTWATSFIASDATYYLYNSTVIVKVRPREPSEEEIKWAFPRAVVTKYYTVLSRDKKLFSHHSGS